MTTSKYLKRQARIKRNFKVFGQVGLGLIVVAFFSPAAVRTDTEKGCFRVTTENV
jgi:hypothetical protein